MNEEVINLPSRFEQLEYLESETSTSGAYAIDTGIKPNQNTGFWIDYNEVSDNVSNYQQAIFGARHGSRDKELQLTHHENGILRFNNTSYPANFNLGTRYQVSLRNRVFTHYDGTQTVLPDTEWQCDYNIHLFCLNNAGTLLQGGATKVYRFKLYDGDTLVRDFIPAYDTILYKPCMYDLVTQTPFYNKSNEELLYPKIEEVINLPYGYKQCLFLESTGTQYINTNYVATNNTGAYVKWSLTNIKNYSNVLSSLGISTDDTADSGFMIPHWNGDNSAYLSVFMSRSENALRLENQTAPTLYSIHESRLNYYNSGEVYIDTTLMGNVDNVSENIENDLPLYLFGCNKLNSLSTGDSMIGRIYRAIITEGEEVAMDLIPCLDDKGKPCMYDLITQMPFYNTNAEGNDFRYVVKGKIPTWYKRVEYLENTSKSYINTNYIPNNKTGLYIEAHTIESNNSVPMGSQDSDGTRIYAPRNTVSALYGWNSHYDFGIGDTYAFQRYKGTTNFLNSRTATFIIDDEIKSVKNLATLNHALTQPCYIFGLNINGVLSTAPHIGKIYRAKISQGTKIVRDFVPVLDENGIPCMFDLVEGIPYYNIGSGEFLYNKGLEGSYTGFGQLSGIGNRLGGGVDGLPPTYTRVNYLESTGTQNIVVQAPNMMTTRAKWNHEVDIQFLESGNARVGWILRNGQNWGTTIGENKYVFPTNGFTFLDVNPLERNIVTYSIQRIPEDTSSSFVFNGSLSSGGKTIEGRDGAGIYSSKWKFGLFYCAQARFAADEEAGYRKPLRIFSCKCWSEDTDADVYYDLIPCLDDNGRPCMFDRVSRMPFYNSGTGEFLYG